MRAIKNHQVKHDKLRSIASNRNDDRTKKVDPMITLKKQFQIATSSNFDIGINTSQFINHRHSMNNSTSLSNPF